MRRRARHCASHSEGTGDACGPGERRRSRRGHGRHRHGRKERVLHTRISEELSEDIRRLAEDLRVPVSNLVRNVLEETFSVVERMSDDVGDLFDEVLDEAEAARERMRGRRSPRRRRMRDDDDVVDVDVAEAEDPADGEVDDFDAAAEASPDQATDEACGVRGADTRFDDVFAWQTLTLNREVKCAACTKVFVRGDEVLVAVKERGLDFTTVVCAGSVAEK